MRWVLVLVLLATGCGGDDASGVSGSGSGDLVGINAPVPQVNVAAGTEVDDGAAPPLGRPAPCLFIDFGTGQIVPIVATRGSTITVGDVVFNITASCQAVAVMQPDGTVVPIPVPTPQ